MLISDNDPKPSLKPTWLQRFFIICSGADPDLVWACKTEWNKYAGIGATIFLTACLAALSGGYAIHLVFDSTEVAIIFGLFWAIVIFNLDRYIVLSLKKERVPSAADIAKELDPDIKAQLATERRRVHVQQLLMASPRFLIAVIIALTVSKPIELRLFKSRIDKELANTVKTEERAFDVEEKDRVEKISAALTSINQLEERDKAQVFANNPIYADARKRIPELETQIGEKAATINSNVTIINKNQVREMRYRFIVDPETNVSSRVAYYVWVPNALARSKMTENIQLRTDKSALETELVSQKAKKDGVETSLTQNAGNITTKYTKSRENLSQQLEQLRTTNPNRKAKWLEANRQSTDLPSQLEALGRVSPSFSAIWWASVVITALFLVLETAPVLIKLLTKRGPYDERLDAREHAIFIEECQKIDELNRHVNEMIKKADDAAKVSGENYLAIKKVELDHQLNQSKIIMDKVANHQQELAGIYIDQWYEEEKQKAGPAVKNAIRQQQSSSTLTGIFWRLKGSGGPIEYFFRNEPGQDGQLIFQDGAVVNKGVWRYEATANELEIELLQRKRRYEIKQLNGQMLQLKEVVSGDVLEFDGLFS